LDFHIGVTTVFDTSRYGKPGRKIIPKGTLVPLKDENGIIAGVPPYITRNTPGFADVLKTTLNIGVLGDNEGPVFEESFSPVLAATLDQKVIQANQGFYRPE